MVTTQLDQLSIIALMGVTGSGKTSFINLASGQDDLKVGKDLDSCTPEVQHSKPFTIDGRQVVLIDTPGFNDTTMSDFKVMMMITALLERSYEKGVKLAGIIYFHRISDERFTGMDARNFSVFRKLCGEQTLKNVVIVTNMWDKVTPEVGKAREQQLSTKFSVAAADKGPRLRRHNGTVESAHAVIRAILENRRLPLQIQEELIDQRKKFPRTETGKEILRALGRDAMGLEDEIMGLEGELVRTEESEQEMRQVLGQEICLRRARLTFVKSESTELELRYKVQQEEMRDKTDFMLHILLAWLVWLLTLPVNWLFALLR